jgi:penicillin-binding protein 1C
MQIFILLLQRNVIGKTKRMKILSLTMRKQFKYTAIVFFVVVCVFYYFSLSTPLFSDPYSTVLQASKGELLSASIASDGQWRFPHSDTVPDKFLTALVTYEDKRFFSHIGIDVRAMARAFRENIRAQKVVSGGSTLSMQVIRLSRKNKSRTVFEKTIEILLAIRLELGYSKNEILNLYASHAPFGGNVVGLEAACWRYFGRDKQELSWGEAALLAVLPNAPSLIHPGKNRQALIAKRNALLTRLKDNGTIDAFTCELAQTEPIPDKPLPIPRHARHLLLRMQQDGLQQTKQKSTIDFRLQERIEQLVQEYSKQLAGNQIHNAAAVVLDVYSGEVLAYVGNVYPEATGYHGNEVDIINSPRSTGSILKPFLYAAAIDDGKILQQTLLPDVPTFINGFSPKNFSKEYDGAVPADKALIRSLNVPAVHLLREYRYEKFHTLLKELGMSTLNQPADHYGLSLILGGAEGTLWDVTGMYASMARTLTNFFQHPGAKKYTAGDWREPIYKAASYEFRATALEAQSSQPETSSPLSASSIYQTFTTLTEVYRPGEETGWRYFNNAKKIAWKTGTSYGYRDGWAVGVTPEFAVGVWVGNADGEGRPGLTGTDAAAPLLFTIFSTLPATTWFQQPKAEMQTALLCKKSGHKASEYCEEIDTVLIPKSGLTTTICPYHQRIHLSADKKFRITSQCAAVASMQNENWFVLPPIQAFYYRTKNISYQPLPPFKQGCSETTASMDMIYPKHNARVFIPRSLDGQTGKMVVEVAHSQPGAIVYWHLDGEYVGSTKGTHQLALDPNKGKHVLTLIDNNGQSFLRVFEVLSGM